MPKSAPLHTLAVTRGFRTLSALARAAGVTVYQTSMVAHGWAGTAPVRAKLAAVLSVSPAKILDCCALAIESARAEEAAAGKGRTS